MFQSFIFRYQSYTSAEYSTPQKKTFFCLWKCRTRKKLEEENEGVTNSPPIFLHCFSGRSFTDDERKYFMLSHLTMESESTPGIQCSATTNFGQAFVDYRGSEHVRGIACVGLWKKLKKKANENLSFSLSVSAPWWRWPHVTASHLANTMFVCKKQ